MNIIIIGEPSDIEAIEALVGTTYDLVDTVGEADELTGGLLGFAALGGKVVLAAGLKLDADDKKALNDVLERVPGAFVDEAVLLVRQQVVDATGTARVVDTPAAFEAAYLEATETVTARDNQADIEVDDDTVVIRDGRSRGRAFTIGFKPDGTVEVNGAILRRTGLFAEGVLLRELVGGRALTAHETLAFIARRLGEVGPEQLLGFGRAFGPSTSDKTNAHLPERNRKFRAFGTVATLVATPDGVRKGTFTDVTALARELAETQPTWLDQQCRELYSGAAAVEGFRSVVEADGRLTLGGKSVKAAGVDVRAFGLHTADGTGYVHVPVVVGAWDESNDGMVYGGAKTLAKLNGFLRETVRAAKDFAGMTRELAARYYDIDVTVKAGDVIQPGTAVFTLGGVTHTWDSKADYGVVTDVRHTVGTDLIEVVVAVEAWFTGHAKIRGLGKGLVSDYASAGMALTVDGTPSDALAVGPGILKDAFAAGEALTERRTVTAVMATRYNRRDYMRAKAKHGVAGRNATVSYGPVTVAFDDAKLTVTTTDPTAIAATGRIIIEAAPVGQAVGKSALTLPQLSWLSGFAAGETLLRKHVLKRAKRRTEALGYMLSAGKGVDAPAGTPGYILGEDSLPVETSGLTDQQVLEAVKAAYPNGIALYAAGSDDYVWLHAGHVLASAQGDGFDLELVGLAGVAAELVRTAADTERADMLGAKGHTRLVRQFRSACATRAQGKGLNQLHAVRWGAAAKVAAADNVPPMTIRIRPDGAVDRAFAAVADAEPGTLHGRRVLVGRMPFVVTAVFTVEYDVRISSNLVLANRADWRCFGKGDSDGDTGAFFFTKDDDLLTDLDAEIRKTLPGYDATLAVRGIAAHAAEAEMWGENSFTGKSVHDKLALRFTKTQDEWVDTHARMGELAHIYTGFSYRMCDLGGLLAGMLVPGGAELAVAGSVLEEDFFLSLNVDAASQTLSDTLEAWFRGKLQNADGFAEAFRPELLGNADFVAALFEASDINATPVADVTGERAVAKVAFEVGKGRTGRVPEQTWAEVTTALAADETLGSTFIAALLGHAASVLGQLAGADESSNGDDDELVNY
jgi:hypothetical protein